MRTGTILSDKGSGLKLMVVEEGTSEHPLTISCNGRGLEVELIPQPTAPEKGTITTDPGMRG